MSGSSLARLRGLGVTFGDFEARESHSETTVDASCPLSLEEDMAGGDMLAGLTLWNRLATAKGVSMLASLAYYRGQPCFLDVGGYHLHISQPQPTGQRVAQS